MADLKLGSQIGGNLIWHQGILELNPLDDSLFYKEFDMITSKGGQTINGTMSLTGDVDTKGRFTAVGNDVAWGSVAQPAFGMDKDNTAGAHWLLASRKRDGSQRAGIQVLTNDSGEMRIYTNKHANYTSFKDGQIYIQATTPSADANATRKDYVDKEINRAMTFAETTTDKLTADLATANTRINTLDAQNVKITGNQNIAGTKTFTDLPVIQDQPTADTHATNKKYVDTKVGTAVQSIGTTAPLTTTGGVNPTLAINQATRTAAGSMSAQDKVKLDDLPADALSRSGGNMKNNAYIKIEGTGGINSLYNSKEYSILRDHNNGNVTLGGAGGDLYVGYNTTSEEYTTKNVLLYAPMKWNNTNRVLVDSDGFIPWASIKDRIGLEGKSKPLKGPINFDDLNLTGDYNLYLARAAGSKNPPPFDYGTMSVVGSETDGNTFVTQMATDLRTNIVYVRTRSDDGTWTAWKKNLNEDSDVGYGYHQKFEVGGDANTFYPVSINMTGGNSGYSWKRYSFSRSYAAKAPDTWHNQTHKGGLTFEFQMANDSSWGGNSQDVIVNEFNQTYTTVCGGMILTTGSMIVWLRGGGAEYMFHSDEGNKTSVVVNLDRYITPDNREFLTRTVDEAIAGYTAEILPRWSIRNGALFDRNRRVMLPDSDVGLTIRNSAPEIQFIETDANDKTYTMVADGGGIRLQEDSSRYVWHYSKTQDSIQLYKPEVTAEGMGTKATSLATKAYVDTNAIPVNYTNGTPIAAYFLDGAQSTVGTKIKLPFKADSARMVVFTVRVYQSYEHFDVKFSGYLYPTTNNWYLAKATIISGSTTIVAKMGKDADGTAYVWLSGGAYRGVAVLDVVGGYNTADWNTGWVISMSDDAPNVVFNETLYPPLSLAGGTLVGNLTARDAVVSLSTSGKKWLSIEAMDKNEPYIAYRASGMDQTVQAIVFNKNEFWSTNRLAANKVRIQDDGGLQFSVDSALNGRSYGIGMNASTGVLGIHQYQDGKWERTPLSIANTGDVVVSGKLTSGASGATNALETVGGYIRSNTADIMSMYGNKYAFVASPMDAHLCQNAYWDGSWKKYNVALKSAYAVCREGEFLVKTSNATSVDPNELIPLRLSFDGNLTIAKSINAGGAILGTTLSSTNLGNPLMELHRPGTHASMIWLNGVNGELNVAKSNGAGGETRRMATWEPTTSHLRNYGGISIPTFSCSWGAYSPSGGINPLNDEARITTGEWHPLLTSPRYIHNTQGYVSRWSIGHFRDSDNRNGSFVINMTGDGNLRNNQRFHFTDLGQLTAAGTHDGGYWTAHANGFDCSRLGGNIIDWVLGNFASKGNVVEWQGIGSYAFLGRFDQGGAVGPGSVLPGTSLYYTQAEGTSAGGNPPGSWRCCGYAKGQHDYGSWNCTVWQRIA